MSNKQTSKMSSRKLNEGFQVRIETAKNAERERTRVKSLREGFQKLQTSLPTVPRDTKLSKLDVLILAMNHINQLTKILERSENSEPTSLNNKLFHPVKKWPMRRRLYAGHEMVSTHENSNKKTDTVANGTDVTSEVGKSSNEANVQETSGNFAVSEFNDWNSLFDVTMDHSLVSMSSEASFNFDDFIN